MSGVGNSWTVINGGVQFFPLIQRHCRNKSFKKIAKKTNTICRQQSEEPSQNQTSVNSSWINLSRRELMGVSSSAASLLVWADSEAQASKLGSAVDNAWEKVGGGPPDLFFPPVFQGVWEVDSVLIDTKTPLGEDFVPDMRSLVRARNEDLNKVLHYKIAFRENSQNKVILDRTYNTAKLVEAYFGDKYNFQNRISWNPDDPNILTLTMPGGLQVSTRVTRRSFNQPSDDLIETSEYFEQIFDNPDEGPAKLKGSQCFTKYRWRDEEIAKQDDGPVIVATQVVSDYLSGYDDEMKVLEARGRPVVVFVYKMAFRRAEDAQNADDQGFMSPKNELVQVQ